ncbi:MAG: threonine/serine exporter family protein [Ruminococcaceae bacterium]|nr:threonine/serine exporter family protein [Oscillospiraceae bacterium]
MKERMLLEAATTLGYRLAMSGAETYRVEETILRVLQTYGYEAEAFAIPNCLIVSIITENGDPITRMRRIGPHGNDLDAVEVYSNLSRAICNRKPDPLELGNWLQLVERDYRRTYSVPVLAIGFFLSAFGFCFTFSGTFADALGAGLCGLIVMAVDELMERLKSTQFFRTIIGAFAMALFAYFIHHMGLIQNADATIIGALMLLVPGLLFTNAMRDVMYGDTNSGLNRVVLVLLIAVAIALGTAAALKLSVDWWGIPTGAGLADYGPVMLNIGAFIGCIGFSIYFNIHGPGMIVCGIGGILTWSTYLLALHLGVGVVFANLLGGIVASVYAEIMARVRRFPAISYLVVSLFPLLPGAGVYYTMAHAVEGDMSAFADKGFETAAIAGALALGILLVSTAFRIWSNYVMRRKAA